MQGHDLNPLNNSSQGYCTISSLRKLHTRRFAAKICLTTLINLFFLLGLSTDNQQLALTQHLRVKQNGFVFHHSRMHMVSTDPAYKHFNLLFEKIQTQDILGNV